MPEEDELGQEDQEGLGEEEHDDSLRQVASSMIGSWGYERAAEQIQIFFANGHEGTYACSPEQWEEAKEAPSPGRFVHQNFL